MAPLVRLVGTAVALEILLEGRIFGAARGDDKGLVTRVVADADVAAKRAQPRSASPKVRRSSRAGTRSSRAGWPIRAAHRRPSTTSASTASTPKTFASATPRFSRSGSRSSSGGDVHRMRDATTEATRAIRARSRGMRVLELAQIMAGPTCGMMLADMGADVIKVEKLPGGDDARGYREPRINGVSAPFLMLNRNKRGIAIDLKQPAGPRRAAADGAQRRRADRELSPRHAGEARSRLRRARRRRIRGSSTARYPATAATVRSPTRAAST